MGAERARFDGGPPVVGTGGGRSGARSHRDGRRANPTAGYRSDAHNRGPVGPYDRRGGPHDHAARRHTDPAGTDGRPVGSGARPSTGSWLPRRRGSRDEAGGERTELVRLADATDGPFRGGYRSLSGWSGGRLRHPVA